MTAEYAQPPLERRAPVGPAHIGDGAATIDDMPSTVLPSSVAGVTFRRLGRPDGEYGEFDELLPGGLQAFGLVLRPPHTNLDVDGTAVMRGMLPVGTFSIPPMARVSGRHHGVQDFIDVLLEPEGMRLLLEDMSIDPRHAQIPAAYIPGDWLLGAVAERLRETFDEIPRIDSLYMDVVLQSCLNILIQRHATSFTKRLGAGPSISAMAMRRVAEYIEENLEMKLRLSDIASIAGVSRAHFARSFRNATGMTPHSYVLTRRLAEALRLLTRSSLPINMIASASGFSDHAHLTRSCKRYYGLTPSELRTERRSGRR